MPLIEELPTTQTIKASHGWAYVPDTGPIAAQQPGTRDRKRAAATTSAGRAHHTATATAKQQKAIQTRLDSLNKENYRDGVNVPLPQRAGASSREKAGRKMTSNVRRILTYQRGFAHYLADEEANNPNGKTYILPTITVGPSATKEKEKDHSTGNAASKVDTNAATNSTMSKRKSLAGRRGVAAGDTPGSATPDTTPAKRGRKRGRPSSTAAKIDVDEEVSTPTPVKDEEQQEQPQDKDQDTVMEDVQDTNSTTDQQQTSDSVSSTTHQLQSQHPSMSIPAYPPEWDHDPLLASTIDEAPRMPSDRVMQLLISEPPLTYNAARATPLEPEKRLPQRHFCGICGYWGKIKCKKCAEWNCGLMSCWKGHEGVCPMANAF